MHNLVKAEFYKLKYMKSFWGITLFSIIVGSLLILDKGMPNSVHNCVCSSLYNVPLLYFLIIIFGALYLGRDFDNRVIHSFVGAGHKRCEVLASKTIVFFIASIVILLSPMLIDLLICAVKFGISVQSNGFEIIRDLLFLLIMICTMALLSVLVAVIFKDVGKTLAVPMVIYFIMIFLLNGEHAQFIALCLPMGQIRLWSLSELSVKLWIIGIYDLILSIFIYAISNSIFKHVELR